MKLCTVVGHAKQLWMWRHSLQYRLPYFRLWDNLFLAYDRKKLSTRSAKENEGFFDNIRIYRVSNSSNYRVIIDSSEKQKLI